MDNFCKFCGTAHVIFEAPQICVKCEKETWHSPSPVAVLIQPMSYESGKSGIVIGRRAINPCKGEWNLIGGFVNPEDKDIFAAARREWTEETGLEASPYLRLMDSFCDGRHLLIFVYSEHYFPASMISNFVVNDECSEIKIITKPETLCFDSHTRALKDAFERYVWN